MSASALRLRGVVKRYGRTVALDHLDFTVPRGVVCGLVGPNGAGKTTTFGIVGGLVRADEGELDVLGAGPFQPAVHAGRVTLLPQDCQLNPHTPIATLLTWYGRLQGLGRDAARRQADALLDELALADRRNQRVNQLSHGMRRRVAVAQALIGQPELVLLDEPTSGLDPDLVVRMRDVLRRRRGSMTLVVSSHVLNELEQVCDHVVFLDNGRCTRAGPLEQVTGRGSTMVVELGVRLDPGALARLAAALPSHQVSGEGSSRLVVEDPSGRGAAALNAHVLPVLLAQALPIIEVRAGSSLEAAWLAQGSGEDGKTGG